MTQDLKFTLRFDAKTQQFVGQVRDVDTRIEQLGVTSHHTTRRLKTMARQSDSLIGEFSGLQSQLLGLAGGFAALYSAQDAVHRLGQYQDIRTQISALIGSQQTWAETEQYLMAVSSEHSKVLTDMSGNYARLMSLYDAGLLTMGESRDIFEGMSNVQSQTGASTVQLEQSMYGLSQALASPIVRAEELNQVVEPMPGLLNKLDKAAGLSAGGFRRMMLDGQVTSRFFKETLISALEDYQGAAARTSGNINAMLRDNTNAYSNMVLAYEQPITDSLTPVLKTTGDAFNVIADNADLVSTAIGVTLFTTMGRGAAAATNYTAVKLRLVVADYAQVRAIATKNAAIAAETLAEIRRLEVMKLTGSKLFLLRNGEAQLTALKTKHTAATNTLAAAQSRLNVVSRAGAGLMAALGGPAGIAFMAAGALSYFALSAETAKDATEKLKGEVLNLTEEFEGLNDQGKNVLMYQLGTEASQARQQLVLVQGRIRDLKEEMAFTPPQLLPNKESELVALERDAKNFQQAVEGANQKFAALLANTTDDKWTSPEKPKGDLPPSSDEATKQADRLLANLTRQVSLYGETSEAAKVRYDIEKGALQGINATLAEQLLLQAQLLDSKKADKKKTDKITDFYSESDELQSAWLMRLAMEADMENQAKIQEQYAYEERLGNLSQSFQAAYNQAIGDQQLMDALEQEYFANREVLRAQHELNLTQIDRDAASERAENQRAVAMQALSFIEQQSSITTNFLRSAGKEQTGVYRALFAVQKAAAIPSMIIATQEAYTKTLGAFPAPYGQILAESVRAAGYASVGIAAGTAITGMAHDGIDRIPKENEGTWLLKANEMVLNPAQADNFRWMVNMMQQMKSMQIAATGAAAMSARSGGTPVTVNVTGVNKEQVSATAKMNNGQLEIDMVITEAVTRTQQALLKDADNGGDYVTKLREVL
ncbi:tape measure protein [Vibrio nomapromontoriensis]|uniref:tape measure protein n=1 Tax=Vibrio nomapromontoriensis TaxID=2910246 RepID=UPI003D0A748D